MRSPRLSQLEAEQCADACLQEAGIRSFPVLPIEIARSKGILVQPFRSQVPGISGFLMLHHNNFGIGYADHLDNEGFVNFVVGHELGHYHLPGHPEFLFASGDGEHFSHSGFVSQEPHEKQADWFSASLLMPQQLFLPAMRKAGAGLAAVKSLSELCKTSLTSTAIRYGELGEDPAAVIVSRGQEIEYAFVCRALKEIEGVTFPRRGDPLPSGSVTYKFNRDAKNVSGAREEKGVCSLNEWFPDAPDHEMNEDVMGLGSYGKTLTVLFTQEAIEETDDGEERGADDFMRRWGRR